MERLSGTRMDRNSDIAKQFKRKLAKLATEQGFTWKKPLIYRESEDDLAFDIRRKDGSWKNSLVFFLSSSGKVSYLLAWGPDMWVDMEDGDAPDDDKIRLLMKLFYTGQGVTNETSRLQVSIDELESGGGIRFDTVEEMIEFLDSDKEYL